MKSLYFFLVFIFMCSSSPLVISSTQQNTNMYVKILDEFYSVNTTQLSLAEQNLDYVPPEIFQLSFLEKLDLSHNNITQLPDEIANLKNLITLDLHSNQITVLPSAFAELENLQVINMHNNPLIHLPQEVIKFKGQILFTSKTAQAQNTFIKMLALLMQRPEGKSIIDFKIAIINKEIQKKFRQENEKVCEDASKKAD